MTGNPYAEFGAYWSAGWRGILPLPYGKKTWPPEGYTGYAGGEPSYADCQAWSEAGPRNLCLRMPDGCVGIDVDHYDGKTGGDTLAGLVARHGALPPTTYSTSRGDGISGIRLYRVPPGTTLPTKLPGIEFIQRHHRYTVAWPSVHPSGSVYQWIDERTGEMLSAPPRPDELPELPAAWVAGLAVEAAQYDRADLDPDAAGRMLAAFPPGDPCAHILAHAGKAVAGGDRHDSYNEAVLAVAGAGRRGCPGAPPVLARLRAAFIAEVTDPRNSTGRRTVGEAEAEWRRNLLGALAIVATEEQGTSCPDDLTAWLDQDQVQDDRAQPDPAAQPSPYETAVRRKLGELLVAEAAKEELAARKAGQAPPLAGHTLSEFLNQPDEGERYRVHGLWPSEGRVLMPAAAKSGKTTLIVGNLIPCLVDGGDFLGAHQTTPVARRVVYFNLEVGPRTLRAWMRRAGVRDSSKVTVVNLRGKVAALGLNSEAGRRRLSDYLAAQDAEVVILDPLAPALAAFGLDENSNADVATFFAWWSAALGVAGVADDLIAHHAGHAGERSRGASRLLDEPDAIWTMTKTANDDDDDPLGPTEIRSLKASGRDVELPESTLAFDPCTGRLTLTGMTRKNAAKNKSGSRIEADILAFIAENEGCIRQEVKDSVTGRSAAIGSILASLIDRGRVLEGWESGRRRLAVPKIPNVPGTTGISGTDRSPFPPPRGERERTPDRNESDLLQAMSKEAGK